MEVDFWGLKGTIDSPYTWAWTMSIFWLLIFLAADAIPSTRAMLLQIYVAMKAMPWYCALPSVSEYMIENGWTRCYSRISEVGWLAYLVYLSIYLVLVEFGIYWMHRELHDIKPLYKYLHATHHIYNKQNTLSPFAGKFWLYTPRFPYLGNLVKNFVEFVNKMTCAWKLFLWCLYFFEKLYFIIEFGSNFNFII